MKKFDIRFLQRGDILLTTSPAFVSKAIRRGIKADISHALIVVGEGSVVDSTNEGVHARNLQRMIYEQGEVIHALRLREPIPVARMNEVVEYARSQVGTRYALREAMRSITNPSGPGNEQQFCSRLVAQSYAEVGIRFTPNPDYCRPDQIQDSILLVPIPGAIAEATSEDQEFAKSPDTTIAMRECTNMMLNQIRAAGHPVENLEQAIKLAIDHEEHDKLVAYALKSSGYLGHWKIERDKHLYRYDYDELKKLESQGELDYQKIHENFSSFLRDEVSGGNGHWYVNEKNSREANRKIKRESIKLMADLYSNICDLNRQRIRIAKRWLQEQQDSS